MTLTSNPYKSLSDADQRWLVDVHSRASAVIKDALDLHGRAPGLSSAIARARVGFLDGELQPVVAAVERAGTPVDCRRGCSSCCTLMVEITPNEVFALVAELESTLDPESLTEAKRRAQEVDQRGRKLPPWERFLLRLFCPVLDRTSGACRGHAVRPAACQGYLSLDRLSCEASSLGEQKTILRPIASDLIRDAVMSAQFIVLQDAGYDQTRIELSAGLAAAWADPAAEPRWLAGSQAFRHSPSYDASDPCAGEPASPMPNRLEPAPY
jgi:Fe-S-cluster containining protein